MSLSGLPQIERLKGRDNWEQWKFAVRAYLEMEGLWDSVLGTEEDVKKIVMARSKLILLVDPLLFIHIQDASTAKEIWENFVKAFDDSGLTRRVSLLRKLITTKMEDCSSMEDFINVIMSTSNKLRSVGMNVTDEWIGTLMLAGLPDYYQPMIMGIESSGVQISGDYVKTKLLQDMKSENSKSSALFSKPHVAKPQYKKNIKKTQCYGCREYGHIKTNCPKNKNSDKNVAKKTMLALLTGNTSPNDWYFDSGATSHMCNNKLLFNKLKNCPEYEIITANNSRMKGNSMGDINIPMKVGTNTSDTTLSNVLYIPDIHSNLLSISSIVKHQHKVIFDSQGCKVIDSENEIIATGSLVDNMFKLNKANFKNYSAKSVALNIWHLRLGHPCNENLKKVVNMVHGMEDVCINNESCTVCMKGKISRLPFKDNGYRAKELLEIVHSDLCGPMEEVSFSGSRYILTFIDDYSRKVFVYFLKSKDQVFKMFEEFKNLVENQTGRNIKILRTDNGTEFCNRRMNEIITSSGIIHQTTAPYTPEQNGLAERMNRTIIEKARCLLIQSNLNKKYWAEAVNTSVYLINRLPCKGHENLTPEEVWSGRKPTLKHLKVFGCLSIVQVPKEKRKKLDAKGKELLFVGYCATSKAYRFLDPKTKNITISRNAVFFENKFLEDVCEDNNNVFYIQFDDKPINVDNSTDANDNFGNGENDSDSECYYSEDDGFTIGSSSLRNTSPISISECIVSDDVESEEPTIIESNDTPNVSNNEIVEEIENVTNSNGQDGNLRRSTRIRKVPIRYANIVSNLDIVEPTSVKQALNSPQAVQWRNAMEEEYRALIDNNTWIECDLPTDKKAISNKWCFKLKRDSTGKILRYKARLVIKGYSQKKGIDYEETFSPVVRYSSIRLLLALAVKHDLDIDQMDVVTAFLQSNLDEDIYMQFPECFQNENGKVCKLKKSLYGLKQASRCWNQKLSKTLISFGMNQSKTDPCIYYYVEGDIRLYIAIYVDDILIFSNNSSLKDKIKSYLMSNFKMKDIGNANFILGMKITRDRKNGKLWIDQELYLKDIIKKFNMSESKGISTPLDFNQKLTLELSPTSEEDINEMKKIPYQEAVGSLLYASQISRPDISYAVGTLSKFNNNPGKAHWVAVKRVFRYLKNTIDFKLEFSKEENGEITGFADADWANDQDNRRSTTGFVFLFQGSVISWNSKRQATVALSTTEAEYMALSAACQEVIWLKSLYYEIYQENEKPWKLYSDNKGAIALTHNNVYHARSKHIDIRHHFLRDLINSNTIQINHVGTEDMVADIFTKALPAGKFNECRQLLGLRNFNSSGGVSVKT